MKLFMRSHIKIYFIRKKSEKGKKKCKEEEIVLLSYYRK